MSPRSEEFMEQARERLSDAQKILGLVHPVVALNTAYYAMLNAARAALSERGEHAKTHSGTWTLFSATFVAPGEFDQSLSTLARLHMLLDHQATVVCCTPTYALRMAEVAAHSARAVVLVERT